MKKPLLAFWLLILCVQAHAGTHKTKHGGDNQQPSANATPIPEPNQNSQTPQFIGRQQTPDEVRIVNPPTKDGWDKAAVLINGLLAVVGISGIVYAGRTLSFVKTQTGHMSGQLEEMKRQAAHMESQTNILKDSVEVSQRSLKVARDAMVLEHPPQMVVESIYLCRPDVDAGEQDIKVMISIRNRGRSAAHIQDSFATVYWSNPKGVGQDFRKDIKGAVIEPGKSHDILLKINEFTVSALAAWAYLEQDDTVEEGEYAALTIAAIFPYIDDVGVSRRTSVARTYNSRNDTFVGGNAEVRYSD